MCNNVEQGGRRCPCASYKDWPQGKKDAYNARRRARYAGDKRAAAVLIEQKAYLDKLGSKIEPMEDKSLQYFIEEKERLTYERYRSEIGADLNSRLERDKEQAWPDDVVETYTGLKTLFRIAEKLGKFVGSCLLYRKIHFSKIASHADELENLPDGPFELAEPIRFREKIFGNYHRYEPKHKKTFDNDYTLILSTDNSCKAVEASALGGAIDEIFVDSDANIEIHSGVKTGDKIVFDGLIGH